LVLFNFEEAVGAVTIHSQQFIPIIPDQFSMVIIST